MKKHESMRDRLIKLMKRRYITPIDALQHAQCLSLSQRVGDLIRDGMAVDKTWRKLPSGKIVRAYRIVG